MKIQSNVYQKRQKHMSVENIFARQVESLQIFDIVLGQSSVISSEFNAGNSVCEKNLVCRLKSDVEFPRCTTLRLRLVAVSDANHVKTMLPTPVEALKTIDKPHPVVEITLVGSAIPIPVGILHLPTTVSSCYPQMIAGSAVRYHFVLYVKFARSRCYTSPGTPLVACVQRNALCDYKCEQLQFSDTQDDEFTIKVVCGSKTVYAKLPHCVTHCQAPRPIVQYYVVGAGNCTTAVAPLLLPAPCQQCNQ